MKRKSYTKRKPINAVVSSFNKAIGQKDLMVCGPKEILESLSSGQQKSQATSIADDLYYWLRSIRRRLEDDFHLSVIPVNALGYKEIIKVGLSSFLRRSVSNLQAYVSFDQSRPAKALVISLGFRDGNLRAAYENVLSTRQVSSRIKGLITRVVSDFKNDRLDSTSRAMLTALTSKLGDSTKSELSALSLQLQTSHHPELEDREAA